MRRNRTFGDHPQAKTLYQEARRHWEGRSPASVRTAIRLLEEAIAIDGSFALACAALADCYSILMDYGIIPPRAGLTSARLAAGRALDHAPDLAESLTSAALVRQMDLDWASAEKEFQAAIATHPDYPVARQRYALFLACMGRAEEARREMDAAVRHHPGSPAVAASAAWVPYLLGQPDRAEALGREAVRRHPNFTSAQVVLALSLVSLGRSRAASEILARVSKRETENVSLSSLHAYSQAMTGDVVDARRILRRLEQWGSERYVSPYYLALPHVGLKNHDAAMEALETARREGTPQLIYLAQDPIFRGLRADSRFTSLLHRLGLPFHPTVTREAV